MTFSAAIKSGKDAAKVAEFEANLYGRSRISVMEEALKKITGGFLS
jgi:hypothetical protein